MSIFRKCEFEYWIDENSINESYFEFQKVYVTMNIQGIMNFGVFSPMEIWLEVANKER